MAINTTRTKLNTNYKNLKKIKIWRESTSEATLNRGGKLDHRKRGGGGGADDGMREC